MTIQHKYASRANSVAKQANSDILLECVKEGCRTSDEIHRRAVTKGLRVGVKNIFNYLNDLRKNGEITNIPGKRPSQWVPLEIAAKETVDPAKEYPPELALMMGYTATPPKGGHTVSPLTVFELNGHAPQSYKRNNKWGIQSGLHGSIYQD
jgi:hypothetical protein